VSPPLPLLFTTQESTAFRPIRSFPPGSAETLDISSFLVFLCLLFFPLEQVVPSSSPFFFFRMIARREFFFSFCAQRSFLIGENQHSTAPSFRTSQLPRPTLTFLPFPSSFSATLSFLMSLPFPSGLNCPGTAKPCFHSGLPCPPPPRTPLETTLPQKTSSFDGRPSLRSSRPRSLFLKHPAFVTLSLRLFPWTCIRAAGIFPFRDISRVERYLSFFSLPEARFFSSTTPCTSPFPSGSIAPRQLCLFFFPLRHPFPPLVCSAQSVLRYLFSLLAACSPIYVLALGAV